MVFRKSGINGHVGIYLGNGEYIHTDSINGVIKTYIHEYPPVLIYRVPASGVLTLPALKRRGFLVHRDYLLRQNCF
ncbi:MAG: C40 family peptidase [Microcystis aeruginosa LG13-12]|nr:C40 family peptidase [Microcystis aeruginosa LG13-12]